ncbi:MAG: nucleotide exchange factor GrpE [Planctomycetaceae bacterium]|nr:MAG: nucleotide exchange factor GrpE [Planctomycetaceae bacterium]
MTDHSKKPKHTSTPETVEDPLLNAQPEATPVEAEGQLFDTLQSDLEKFRDLALRSQADLDNYRKRAAREKEEAIRFANSVLLERLLPVLDSFELGLAAARSESETSPVFQGMNMVYKQLNDFLVDSGAQGIDAVGQPFDPNRHDAVGQEHSEDVPDGSVVRQIRKGYVLHGRLLRPAGVFVSTGPATA